MGMNEQKNGERSDPEVTDCGHGPSISGSGPSGEEMLHFFSQPIGDVCSKDVLSCSSDTSIRTASELMTRHHCSSILVKNPEGEFIGIVTDHYMRKKVIADGYDPHFTVMDIVASPLHTLPGRALVFESYIEMMREKLRYLVVTDDSGDVMGILTSSDLVAAQLQSPFFLMREIFEARSKTEIIDKHGRLPEIIRALIQNGAKARNVCTIITAVSDAILRRLIFFALEEVGPSPVRFAFMTLGSEGRKEQTLKTDQDNAIVYEDVAGDLEKTARDYFSTLGRTVCTWLDEAGFDLCKGEVMAKNPKWCQPLSVWKNYFKSWIFTADPEDLLRASIFFDFHRAYGDKDMVRELRSFLFSSLKGWPGFFRHLAENALHVKPPLNLFRNIAVESKGPHRKEFDIKKATLPIVDIARIYALKHGIAETNTQERLRRLHQKKVLSLSDYLEIDKAYDLLMHLRFTHQVATVIQDRKKPDNYISPGKLSRIEVTMLKEAFKCIENFQAKLRFEFIGDV